MSNITTAQRRRVSSFREPRGSRKETRLLIPPAMDAKLSTSISTPDLLGSSKSSESLSYTDASSSDFSDSPTTPDSTSIFSQGQLPSDVAEIDLTSTPSHNAKTTLVTQDPGFLRQSIANSSSESATQLFAKYCCGGQCLIPSERVPRILASPIDGPLEPPTNEAYQSLNINLHELNEGTHLSNIIPLPERIVSFSPLEGEVVHKSTVAKHPPTFVQPHPPYQVFSAPVFHARELTKPGAEKRTFHFDIDVTEYPDEAGVDFKVGGAVGVCPPNKPDRVEEVFDLLGITSRARDKPLKLHTNSGRWPTIWGEEEARELTTTRRELLTWCTDIQSNPPTKAFLRLLAEHATSGVEKKILLYLASAEGQTAFCDLRTGPHLSLAQMLHSFPSSKPPLEDLLSVLPQLMPRFYSLSNDPHVSSEREGLSGRRLIEIAVTVHQTNDWRDGTRTGTGSGFLERLALDFIDAETRFKEDPQRYPMPDFRVPLFRGLMANPLSKEFGAAEGPMVLIGAGVGMAPFRGFILNRLKNANCASKIWLVQGIRDASVDELYQGELGQYESQIKKVVESRGGRQKPKKNTLNTAQALSEKARRMSVLERGRSETDLKAIEERELEKADKEARKEARQLRRASRQLEREKSRRFTLRLEDACGFDHEPISEAPPVEHAILETPTFKAPFEEEQTFIKPAKHRMNGFTKLSMPKTPARSEIPPTYASPTHVVKGMPGAWPQTPGHPPSKLSLSNEGSTPNGITKLRSSSLKHAVSTGPAMQTARSSAVLPTPSSAAPNGDDAITPGQESRYVQDEVRNQADIVWDVITAADGRIFVCGSSAGMGKGVEEALEEVAMKKAGFEGSTEDEKREGARRFWEEMKEKGKYVVETW